MLTAVRTGTNNREQSLFCCTNLTLTQISCTSGSFTSKGAQVPGMSHALGLTSDPGHMAGAGAGTSDFRWLVSSLFP